MASTRQRKAGVILAAAGWAFILFATLVPLPEQADTSAATNIWCLVCGELGMVDVSLNIVLFIPLGLGLGLLGVTWLRGWMVIVLTTLSIEVLQLSIVTGRDASLSDLVTNTIGGWSGLVIAANWRRILFTSPRTSALLATTGAVAWLVVQGFTTFALQRTLPRSVYYGQWAPELGQFERFTGKVTAVHLNSLALPGTRLANSDVVREQLLSPGSILEVRALSGLPTLDLAPLFSIFDDRQREIVLVGQDGRDLIFRVRTRTAPLGLRSPALRLARALPEQPDTPVRVRAQYETGHYRLDARIGQDSHSRDMALSASWGWTFLLPFDHAFGREMPWLTMLWVGGLLLPIGYYAGRSRRDQGKSAWVLLLGLLAIGLVLIPMFAGFAVGQPLEWAGGLVGGMGGFRLAANPRGRR